MLSFFPRDVLGEILNLIESLSEGVPTYYFMYLNFHIIFQIYNHHFRSVYDPSGPTLAILYREVLHAKYQPNRPSGSGEEVV